MKEEYIKGSDKVCGVIGDPIEHTLSPLIHNALAKAIHERAVYVPFHVTRENLKSAIDGAHALKIAGLNATMPHKQELFKYVVKVDPQAEQVGAINTLVYSEEGYIGYNTDAEGLALSLKEQDIVWQGQKVAIIGSGGAAYAAYTALAKEASELHIINRTKSKAEALKAHMAKYFDVPTFVYEDNENLTLDVDIVVQTTGVGMGELKDKMPRCSKALLQSASTAVDIIYEPEETLFLKTAKEAGCKCVNGFGMLYYQAVIAFELMHHLKYDLKTALQIKGDILKIRS